MDALFCPDAGGSVQAGLRRWNKCFWRNFSNCEFCAAYFQGGASFSHKLQSLKRAYAIYVATRVAGSNV